MSAAAVPKSVDYVREYVDAMRTSSDRSRYALYILVVVTMMVFIYNYNMRDSGWPRRRLDTWYTYARETGRHYNPPPYIANGDAERLKAIRAEYVKQFASRAVLTPTPIPGTSIDINDLGLFSGIALVLLSGVLLICVAREHENLHLSLFKIRMLCQEDGEDASAAGDSRANLLYHALAMCQVLHSPPTLARWKRHGALHYLRIIFLAPAFVFMWVFWSEWTTQHVAAQYGVTDKQNELLLELAAVVVLLVFGVATWAHSSAMALRWERAFFRVNPKRRLIAQATVSDWLKILPTDNSAQRWHERITTAIADNIIQQAKPLTDTVDVESPPLKCDKATMRRKTLTCAVENLVKDGERRAREKCNDLGDFVGLAKFNLAPPQIVDDTCVLRGTWTFEYKSKPAVAGELAPT